VSPRAQSRSRHELPAGGSFAIQRQVIFWPAATIGVLARFALRRYLASSLYTGGKSG
jgi:hypothetical protein